jgi:hypothetical protein
MLNHNGINKRQKGKKTKTKSGSAIIAITYHFEQLSAHYKYEYVKLL